MLAWNLLFLVLSVIITASSTKTVRVRDPHNLADSLEEDRLNNECRPDFGKLATFRPEFFDFEERDFCQQLRELAHGVSLPGECTAYDNQGEIIDSYEQLQDNTTISLVPAELPFIWQSDRVGEILFVKGGPTEKLIELETMSIEPRVYKIRNLITDQEIDEFVQFAQTKKMDRSTVGDILKNSTSQNAGSLDSDRTSHNTWDTDSSLALKVQQRVFELLRVPFQEEWAEGFQILHYTPGQFYNSHEDWFDPDVDGTREYEPSLGGANRFATLFLYLSTVELGGETVFPKGLDVEEDMATRARAEALRNELVANGTILEDGLEWHLFDTCRRKLHTKPVKGEVILFYNIDSRGVLDSKAQHGACAPLTGDKWGSNLWIWNGPYHLDEARTADLVNYLDEAVQLYWRSPTGDESLLDTLEVGGSYQSFTFVGHTFVARNTNKMWVFTVEEEPEKQLFAIRNSNSKQEL